MMSLFIVFVLTGFLAFQAQADLLSDLRALNVGAVFPGDAQYAGDIKSYNQRFNFQPVAVTFPNTSEDVSKIVQVGVKYGRTVTPRSGGHSYVANGLGGADGSLIVDMSLFKSIEMHTDNETAMIGTGNRVGDIALGLFQHGRAMPHGGCPYIGIGGHANFGGFGLTSRMWGLTLDVIESIDLVLSNGTIATVSSYQHSDLFWAMRGAGSSYAITTALHVRTFPAPESGIIASYTWYLNSSQAADALVSFQSFVHSTQTLPPYYGGQFVVSAGPSPGLLSIVLLNGFWGPPEKYNSTLAPWLAKMPLLPNKTVETQGNYIESLSARVGGQPLNTSLGPDTRGTFYVKSLVVPEVFSSGNGLVGITKDAWNAVLGYLVNTGLNAPVNWFIEVELWGGQNSAIQSIPRDSTAFAYRHMIWTLQIYTSTSNNNLPPYPNAGFAFTDGIANTIIANMPADWEYGAYINFLDNRLQNWQQLYYAHHYPLLRALKSKYDPLKTFDFPTAIQTA